jgi:hypothetical protein
VSDQCGRVPLLDLSLAIMSLVWPVGLALLAGCSESSPTTKLSGTVSYQGEPLDHGSLRFYGADGRPIGSVIREDGTYQIDLLPGEYTVGVTSPPKLPPGYQEGDQIPHDPRAVPPEYGQPQTSSLSTTIAAESAEQTYDISLK